jgi:hypothetical protein
MEIHLIPAFQDPANSYISVGENKTGRTNDREKLKTRKTKRNWKRANRKNIGKNGR